MYSYLIPLSNPLEEALYKTFLQNEIKKGKMGRLDACVNVLLAFYLWDMLPDYTTFLYR